MIGFILSPLSRHLAPYAAVLISAGLLILVGVKWQADRQALQDHQQRNRTNEQINGADIGTGDSGADLEWMLRRGQPGGLVR